MYFHNMESEHNVFVVDDDPSARKGIARLVRAAGYNVCTHGSANEFLSTLNPTVTGCVILDARMPGMSGEDLAAKLKKHRERLSIIFVTADDDPAVKHKAKELGAAGFFRKPVDGTALLDAINWSFNEIDENNHSMT
jgi:two-component system response regulator FixJ